MIYNRWLPSQTPIFQKNPSKYQFFNNSPLKNLHIPKIFCIFALDFQGFVATDLTEPN